MFLWRARRYDEAIAESSIALDLDPSHINALWWQGLAYAGKGDFLLDGDGRLVRRADGESAPFLFAGIQILHPRIFAGTPVGAFSLNLVYDRAIEAGMLFGMVHRGEWCHVGVPADIQTAEQFLARAEGTG